MKGLNVGQFIFVKKGKKRVVADSLFKQPLIKNSQTANKPVYKKINGQDLHTLTMNDYTRSNIINTLKDYFIPILTEQTKHIQIKDYPIAIVINFLTPRKEISDLDNHALFYEKCILDVLQPVRKNKGLDSSNIYSEAVNLIPDDTVDYINDVKIRWFKSFDDKHNMIIQLFKYESDELLELQYYFNQLVKHFKP